MEKVQILLARLSNAEDSFTERKLEGVSSEDIARTIIGFANSVPLNESGVLFLGIGDKGHIAGVSNPDSLQKTIRQICENKCFPRIEATCAVLEVRKNDHIASVLAAEVPFSNRAPHFMGPAFLRVGSETVKVSEQQYDDLFTRRCTKTRQLLDWKNQIITVIVRGKKLGETKRLGTNYRGSYECRITECTPHYARFDLLGYGQRCSEPLSQQ